MKTHKTAKELEAELGFLESGCVSSVCERCANITRSSIQDMRELSDELSHVRAEQFHLAMDVLRIVTEILEDDDGGSPKEKLYAARRYINKSMDMIGATR